MNFICPKCKEELNESDRCCLKCGILNPYNKENKIEENNIKELSKVYDNEKAEKKSKILFIASFLVDLLYWFLIYDYIHITFRTGIIVGLIISFFIVFYRYVVLKFLLLKSDLFWAGVYIPIYGFLLILKLGVIENIEIFIKSIWMFLFGIYWIIIDIIVESRSYVPILLKIFLKSPLIAFIIYIFCIYVRICKTLSFRFKKNNKFTTKLIFLYPIYILFLAFDKETGKTNIEQDDI